MLAMAITANRVDEGMAEGRATRTHDYRDREGSTRTWHQHLDLEAKAKLSAQAFGSPNAFKEMKNQATICECREAKTCGIYECVQYSSAVPMR